MGLYQAQYMPILLLLSSARVAPQVFLKYSLNKLNKEEKLLSLSILISWALIIVLNIIPILGAILALVMFVLHIIAIVKFFKGDLNHQIPVASKIAAKFVK